jgi:hypothetical protein
VTIGGGDEVPPELSGRVLELVRVTGTFGETAAFVRNPELARRLARWPVAVVLSEVYTIGGEPRLVDDLGFPDRKILTNAFDSVRRDDELVARLWERMQDWPVERNWRVPPLPGFRDSGTVKMFGSRYPQVPASSTEGKEICKESIRLERDPALSRAVKAANRERNGGLVVCEGCGLCEENSALFDAHHLQPLAAGIRQGRVDDFAVLCPTCHRWAHGKGRDALQPLTIAEVRAAHALRVHRPFVAAGPASCRETSGA